jgi:hypothetical protein
VIQVLAIERVAGDAHLNALIDDLPPATLIGNSRPRRTNRLLRTAANQPT